MSRLRATACASSLLVFLGLAGCQVLLGDFTLEAVESGCKRDAQQCVGNVLQACKADGSGWDNRAVCASEKLCDPLLDACLPPKCAAGERRCDGAQVEVCSVTRDAWVVAETCVSAGRCSAESGTCTSEPCTPRALQCNGATLQTCNDDRAGWSDVPNGQCGSAALCNREAGKCDEPVCQPGKFNCAGAELQTCNTTLNGWTTVQSCDSDALCDEERGTCGEGQCALPGVFRCEADGTLQRCAEDLTGWLSLGSCPSEAQCDAVNGKCTTEPCTPGAYQCNGATLEVCSADSTAWDPVVTCLTDGLCQATLSAHETVCELPVCMPGEARCAEAQPQTCNSGRTDFRDNGPPCVSAELCANGACSPPVCGPNDTDCDGAQPRSCNAARTGFAPNGPACASAALCNPATGTCGNQVCFPGQLRCDPESPTHLQRCNADLTAWEPNPCDICDTAELCSSSLTATTCDETSCKEPVCVAGTPRCSGSGADTGKALEVCNTGRTGYTPCQTCVTKELCDASLAKSPFVCSSTACALPTCNLTDKWCGGTGNTTFSQCPASRMNTQPVVLGVCATNGLCELSRQQNKTTCEQPSCALTDLWCGGTGNTTLYQCPASRINSQAVALGACATNGLCELSRQQGKTACEAPKCATGATQCGGSGNRTLQMCKSDRTGYMDCDTCDTAALCEDSLTTTSCNSSACLVCDEGEAHCADGDYQVCNATRTGFDVTDCMDYGCDEATGCLAPAPDGGAEEGG